jgi:hypothetical protein
MSDYETSYDPKYGYNRNAFAHKTLPMKIVGKTVKLIAMPIGLPAKPSTITKTSSDHQAAEKISMEMQPMSIFQPSKQMNLT